MKQRPRIRKKSFLRKMLSPTIKMKEQWESSLWGEGRSPSFIFLVYPNTVAPVQQAPGQATIHNWSDMRSAVCAPERADFTLWQEMPWETHFFIWLHMGHQEMLGLPLWGWERLLGWSGCWGLNYCKFYTHLSRGVKPANSRVTPGPEVKHSGSWGKQSIT